MRKSISIHIKNQVILRSEFKCEYCLLPKKVSFYNFHIDHIRPLKHGGSSHFDNLAYCCPDCNYFKGTDIGSFENEDVIVRFLIHEKIIGKTILRLLMVQLSEKRMSVMSQLASLNLTKLIG